MGEATDLLLKKMPGLTQHRKFLEEQEITLTKRVEKLHTPKNRDGVIENELFEMAIRLSRGQKDESIYNGSAFCEACARMVKKYRCSPQDIIYVHDCKIETPDQLIPNKGMIAEIVPTSDDFDASFKQMESNKPKIALRRKRIAEKLEAEYLNPQIREPVLVQ